MNWVGSLAREQPERLGALLGPRTGIMRRRDRSPEHAIWPLEEAQPKQSIHVSGAREPAIRPPRLCKGPAPHPSPAEFSKRTQRPRTLIGHGTQTRLSPPARRRIEQLQTMATAPFLFFAFHAVTSQPPQSNWGKAIERDERGATARHHHRPNEPIELLVAAHRFASCSWFSCVGSISAPFDAHRSTLNRFGVGRAAASSSVASIKGSKHDTSGTYVSALWALGRGGAGLNSAASRARGVLVSIDRLAAYVQFSSFGGYHGCDPLAGRFQLVGSGWFGWPCLLDETHDLFSRSNTQTHTHIHKWKHAGIPSRVFMSMSLVGYGGKVWSPMKQNCTLVLCAPLSFGIDRSKSSRSARRPLLRRGGC